MQSKLVSLRAPTRQANLMMQQHLQCIMLKGYRTYAPPMLDVSKHLAPANSINNTV